MVPPDRLGYREIDDMILRWRERMLPHDPQMRASALTDTYHHVMLETMRRMAHHYDEAMRLEDIPEEKRRRVLSMILLGDPSGLQQLEAQRIADLVRQMHEMRTPAPIMFSLPKEGR